MSKNEPEHNVCVKGSLEEFVQKQLHLLDIERDAEIEENR